MGHARRVLWEQVIKRSAGSFSCAPLCPSFPLHHHLPGGPQKIHIFRCMLPTSRAVLYRAHPPNQGESGTHPVVPEANDDDPVVLCQDGLVDVPAALEPGQEVGHGECG